jgi:hypothetical protein
MMIKDSMKIGVIADTHGVVLSGVKEVLPVMWEQGM